MIRLISNLFMLVSVFVLPPYVSALLLVVFIFIFSNFAESIFWALIIDSLYSGGLFFGYNFHYIFTLSIIIIFTLSFKLKKQIKFY